MSLPSPLQYLHTAGPAADPVTTLGWGLGAVSAVVLAVVCIALVAGLVRRRAPLAPGELAVPGDQGGLSWIYIGVSISALVLAACAAWTVVTLRAIAMPAQAARLTVEVTAAQWWWRARYRDADRPSAFQVANELHVPVGRPVRIELTSEDVIHSFWVPQLAGKVDAIPGRTNVLWLQADRPGTYRGQCGEFCGAEHARMQLVVVADSAEDYARWRDAQQAPATPQQAVAAGQAVFQSHCGACHAVRGTPAGGLLGPDLTHLKSRHTLAAGLLPDTPDALARWIEDPQALKPGTRMPNPKLSPEDRQAVLAYLGTLN
ncbi:MULTISPECIES: cytochrome c oxidase subunit II [Ramlibacter]|uniref:Cytochrome aa3 subunit 2 n=1 Tax=Ramlibacter aquaticus TaxID=2780094 RepID=A0ABR9SIP0_9BURK|nr:MULTISPECIES: cytochrome c oxidase subunit II [Ramlibacter]MBE7942044.1 cytochrome c oxidase subunit II [Ramlibacter aquaticus]